MNFLVEKKNLLVAILIIGFITPSIILFFMQVLIGNYSVILAIKDIFYKQFAPGHNYFLLSIIGMIPFIILSMILIKSKKIKALSKNKFNQLCIVGLLGILILMVPGHVAVWLPVYGPGDASSTSVIAFLFIPFYSLFSMLIGIFIFLKFFEK